MGMMMMPMSYNDDNDPLLMTVMAMIIVKPDRRK
jgi:hypothetical protein